MFLIAKQNQSGFEDGEKILQAPAQSLNMSRTTLYFAIQFYIK